MSFRVVNKVNLIQTNLQTIPCGSNNRYVSTEI